MGRRATSTGRPWTWSGGDACAGAANGRLCALGGAAAEGTPLFGWNSGAAVTAGAHPSFLAVGALRLGRWGRPSYGRVPPK